MGEGADALGMYHHTSTDAWFVDADVCDCCEHPAWAHGPGGICSECDASHKGGACGLLSLFGFDLAALPLDERVAAHA